MEISADQKRILSEKGWPNGVIADFESMQPDETVTLLPIGLALGGKGIGEVADGLQADHPGLKTFSDRGMPIINVSGTVSVMLGTFLDPRVIPAHKAEELLGTTQEPRRE